MPSVAETAGGVAEWRGVSHPNGILNGMANTLEWIGAIGGTAATVGTWLGPLRGRWTLAAAHIREGRAMRENELHRQRFGQVYRLWHDMPDGPERADLMHWYGEWTGAREPRKGTGEGAIPPGFGCRDEDEAYERYLSLLQVQQGDAATPLPAAEFAVPSRRRGLGRRRALPGTASE